MKIVEAKSWLDGHPQFQTESQWAYVMRMLTGYGAAVERAAEAAAIERCAKAVRSEELCDAGDTADDIAYNHAIDHAEKAIRALLQKEES